MSTRPLRLLLDQQFPRAPFDVHALDATVTYVHLHEHAPEYSRTSTPDWMLHLIAAEGGFDALVTIDRSQLDEEAELVALNLSGTSVVTFRGGEEDPVVMWGLLLAYMPQIQTRLAAGKSVVITLPSPRLQDRQHVEKPGDMARAMKSRDNVSFDERRARSVAAMTKTLNARGASHLLTHLHSRKK